MTDRPEDVLPRTARPDRDYDVIVCGGGPAGIAAAVASAMTGATTLILEGRSQFGGTATAAMWMEINVLFKDDKETSRGGVHEILVNAIRKWGRDASRPGKRNVGWFGTMGNLHCHPEYLKKVIFDLFDEYGIDYQLYSPVVNVERDGSRLTGVVAGVKEGRVTFHGKTIVDATGDGDVAWLAGCEMAASGDEDTGWRPPVTVAWAVCNVDCERFFDWCGQNAVKTFEWKGKECHGFGDVLGMYREQGCNLPSWVGLAETTIPGVISVNNGTSGDLSLDFSQSAARTLIEKMAIDQALEFMRLAREEKFPGMENVCLMRTGGFAMARDTRRLIGEYVFTEKDCLEGTDFDDAVASKYGGSDPVGTQRGNVAIKQGAKLPYRMLLPKDVDGLLVTGRCASATMLGHYGGKSMGNMISLGQAAGVAAALCAGEALMPRQLDAAKVQARLAEMGVSL
jgi:hypothetical protein